MRDALEIIRWVYLAVLPAYLIVQVLAYRRLKGDYKRRSNTVLTVMLVVMFGSDAIRDIFFFENYVAGRVVMAIVAATAIIATIVLVPMLGKNSNVAVETREEQIQSVKLS